MARYWQRAETIDYVNSGAATIPAGGVISLTSRIAVAGGDIEPGALGSAHVTGGFFFKKGAETIAQGAAVYWNTTTGVITTTSAGNVPAGWAIAAAAAGDSEALVKIG